MIDQPGDITITHASGTHSVNSILSQESLVLSGGSLTVSNTVQVNGSFTVSGGTLIKAVVLAGTDGQGLTVGTSGGVLDGVTLNGNAVVGPTGQLTVRNGLMLNATLTTRDGGVITSKGCPV